MHTCERCGTRFGRVTASGSCPRCLARDGVRVDLSSRSSKKRVVQVAPLPGSRPSSGPVAAVRSGAV